VTDLAIRGGSVLDGLGSQPVLGDVVVAQHRLPGDAPGPAPPSLDASGCWVLPGFVDLHSHADLTVLTGEGMRERHAAGITTEVVGQDGLGFVPGSVETLELVFELMHAIAGEPPADRWSSTEGYLDVVARAAVSHVATLASHGTARIEVAGMANRPLTEAELGQLRALSEQAVSEGAVGLSTGLSYPPARSSDASEIIAAYEPFAAHGLPYVTHLRDYGTGFEAALEEAIEIASGAAGGILHLAHFHVSGPGRVGEAGRYLGRLDAVADQLTVTWDSYPYTAACTFLASFLPDWVLERPGVERASLLREQADEIATELDHRGPGATVAVGWDGFLLAGTGREHLDGRRLVDAASDHGRSPGQMVVELCREAPPAVLIEQGHLGNVRAIAGDPRHRGGSDGIMGSGIPHPRATGTFLRWLRWARDGEVGVSIPEMVRHLTSAAADTIRVADVGRLVPGALADLVVVDPSRLDDGPDHHLAVPDAVRHLVIGGRPVIVDGEHRGLEPVGRALRWS
jgi:N-acyl-D-amino-acid deacylase